MARLDLNQLNPEQREAVTTIDGPLMILAGAGTGKTRVITSRIAYLLDSGVQAEQIVALSFTNKAAREMTERATHLVGPRAKKVWMGTFHSFCLHLLRKYHHEADLVRNFGLAGTSDQIELVRKALEEKNWLGTFHADQTHYQIGIAKNHLLTPHDLREGKGQRLIQTDPIALAEIFEIYNRQLKLNRVIDFDDCIYKCVFLLREHPEVREKVRKEFRYLMVDEYQDTNKGQLSVIELIASDTHDVCVVGDDDQSIYSWRGAMYEVIEQFEEMFPKTKIIKLEQNYRCSNVILEAANTVIKNNQRRKDKTLWSASKDTAPITLSACQDETEEANLVAEKCISLLGSGLKPKDISILYRANNLAKNLELALREARIPYKTFGGQSFFERKEVKDFVCYLRLVLNHDDHLALWRVINTPHRGIGLKTLEKIDQAMKQEKKSPFTTMRSFGIDIFGTATSSIGKFCDMITELSAMPLTKPEDFEALGLAIIKLSGLETDIRLKTENAQSRDRKLANLRSLPKWLATLSEDHLEDGFDRQAFFDSLALDNDRKDNKKDDGDYVSLMTVHASKGLEFPAVFVVGVEEELLPHKNSLIDPQALCEERRLFYVALTRAKTRLFLSYCVDRQSNYQSKIARKPSRFLAEVPASVFIKNDEALNSNTREQAADTRRQNTVKRLGSLRESLLTKPKQI